MKKNGTYSKGTMILFRLLYAIFLIIYWVPASIVFLLSVMLVGPFLSGVYYIIVGPNDGSFYQKFMDGLVNMLCDIPDRLDPDGI